MAYIGEAMVEDNLENFYNDGSRFKNHKLLIDFNQIEIKFDIKDIELGMPKYKKKQIISKYIKPSRDKNSLF